MDFYKVFGAVGTAFGIGAVIYSIWVTRSKLELRQKSSSASSKFHGNAQGFLQLTIHVSNLSNRQNSIIQWRAWMKTPDGKTKELRIPQGSVNNPENGQIEDRFNVTPVNIPAHSTIESKMFFLEINKPDYDWPMHLKLEAHDHRGRRYVCFCSHPYSEPK